MNGINLGETTADKFKIVELSQQVETEYVGSPCGQLDQIMIVFAKAGNGTHYIPATQTINYVPLGAGATDFAIMGLDTGTDRPGLEKSTYIVRRRECDELAEMAGKEFGFSKLADVKDEELYQKVLSRFQTDFPDHCDRLRYIYAAQQRFYQMLDAWKAGDIESGTTTAPFRFARAPLPTVCI